MTLILCIKKGRSRAQFMKDAKRAGVDVHPIEGLPRHFTVEGYTLETFPLAGHTALITVEDGEDVSPEPNAFSVAADLGGGSWSIARHIRRDAPWNVDRIRHPFSTYFRSARDGTGVDLYAVEGTTRTTHEQFGGRLSEIHTGETDTASPHHGTAAWSLAMGNETGFARGAQCYNARWGSQTTAQFVAACGAILAHYNGRSTLNRPAVCWIALQSSVDSASLKNAVDDMIDAGIVIVSVAGNFAEDMAVNPRFPGTYPDVICVAAVWMNDTPALMAGSAGEAGTGYGTRVDVSAATVIHSADVASDTAYRLFGGTSAAEPVVAGVVACMLTGKARLTTRAQVQAVRAKVIANATTGRLRDQPQFGIPAGGLPDRILYLDPDIASEEIAGIT